MQIILASLADSANSTIDGKLNMLGVFSSIYTTEVPYVCPALSIIVAIRGEIGDQGSTHKMSIILADEDMNERLRFADLPFRFALDDERTHPESPVIVNIQQVQFYRFGQYVFKIELDGHIAHEIPLLVQPIVLPPEG